MIVSRATQYRKVCKIKLTKCNLTTAIIYSLNRSYEFRALSSGGFPCDYALILIGIMQPHPELKLGKHWIQRAVKLKLVSLVIYDLKPDFSHKDPHNFH